MVSAFTTNSDGILKNIKMVEMIDVASVTEIIRISNNRRWLPAQRGGKPVSWGKIPDGFSRHKKIIAYSSANLFNSLKYEASLLDVHGFFFLSSCNWTRQSNSDEYGYIWNERGRPTARVSRRARRILFFFIKNFRLPEIPTLIGKIFLSFVVETDGTLSDIKTIKDIGFGTGAEAENVLHKSPKWIPGKKDEKLVRVLYLLPIPIQTH